MSERLRDVQTRVHSVQQLSAVITAMRGIAAARSREAQASLEGIRAYAGVVATAIGRALALQPVSRTEPPASAHGAHAVVALCAEQGFAGVFNERVLDAAMRAAGDSGQPTLYLIVGNRGASLAEERGLSIDWSGAMVARVAQAPELANRVVEALYQRMATRHVARVTVVYAIPGPTTPLDIVQRRLVPFDFNRFAPKPSAIQPLTTLAPSQLLAKLVEEYVFAELCEAATLSFAAENEARMRAMIVAHEHVEDRLGQLVAQSHQLRQEEITSEIIELAGGATARNSAPETSI